MPAKPLNFESLQVIWHQVSVQGKQQPNGKFFQKRFCAGTVFSVEIFWLISFMRKITLVTPNPEEILH